MSHKIIPLLRSARLLRRSLCRGSQRRECDEHTWLQSNHLTNQLPVIASKSAGAQQRQAQRSNLADQFGEG